MNSSCEVPTTGAGQVLKGSRVLRFMPPGAAGAPFAWDGLPAASYKDTAAHHRGVLRMVLAGETGEKTSFHVRYFEIAPGGFSSREQHQHEHVVVVLRGRGEVELGQTVQEVGFGDTVYVAPGEAHQFRNPSPAEPFGFLCMVDAQRDRPAVVAQP